jgi:hypothetical protein
MAKHVECKKADRSRKDLQDARLRKLAGICWIAREAFMVLEQGGASLMRRAKSDFSDNRQLESDNGLAASVQALQHRRGIRVKARRHDIHGKHVASPSCVVLRERMWD